MSSVGAGSGKDTHQDYVRKMTDKGAWPETHESEFHDLQARAMNTLSALNGAKSSWDRNKTSLFGGPDNWKGKASAAASEDVEAHSSVMNEHVSRLNNIIEWCNTAVKHIGETKETIRVNVNAGISEINKLIDAANSETDPDQRSYPQGKIDEVVQRKYNENVQTITGRSSDVFAAAGGEKRSDEKKRPDGKDGHPKTGDGDGEEGGKTRPALFASHKSDIHDVPTSEGLGTPLPPEVHPNLSQIKSSDTPNGPFQPPAEARPSVPSGANTIKSSDIREPERLEPAPAPNLSPSGQQPAAPPKQGVPTPPVAPSAPNLPGNSGSAGGGGGVSGAPGAPSPLSSGGSSGPSGLEQAANASQAAGQGPAGQAPVNPLQEFAKGFADSSNAPVHAASSGGAPPLAPSPAVPASDAMAPASSSAPLSQAGAPASAAPIQAPSSGGSMGGMGMGGGMPMGAPPLGPPPTAPPAAPVPPAAAPPPAVTPAANVAGGAQVAPIPVSAARAQRDAAQDAAKRSGSDPLVLARRIAAALNAPDMVDEEDFIFFWITAVTVDGKIVVANNYGLAFIPEQVQLPEHVAMATADESIPPAERASWVTHPVVAVQRWAQHHDMKLRAVIATEDQFKNSDAGVHQEVLTPEDIPAKGQMAGRDRLKVIAPQIASRLAQISDGDLVKILPPAPVDTNPPEDRRLDLWDAVWQPLCSGASNRGQVHLQAFLEYASHAQEWAVYEAHAAGDGPEQRRAVADFIYWQHIGQLVADAMAE